MPIPLLFIGAAAVSGAFGLGKTVQASADQKEAKETHNRAERYINEAKDKVETCRRNCGDALDNLGRRKIQILDESIKPFIQEFEKLNHVELSESKGLNELQKMVLDKKEFSQLKDLQSFATSLASGMVTGTMLGSLTAFGAYSAAGVLASASTGTAIATLHGVAATNATLAFFGGGSLAAGGLGMAGGTAVLGGLVAGPALAVLGIVAGAKASANKDAAYAGLAKAKAFKEEMDTASLVCIGIRKRANMFSRFLLSLNSVFEPLIFEMQQIIRESGTDYRTFSMDEKKTIAEAMAIAGAIKAILDTPILDEDGNLTKESERIIEKTTNQLHGVDEPNNEFENEKECSTTAENNNKDKHYANLSSLSTEASILLGSFTSAYLTKGPGFSFRRNDDDPPMICSVRDNELLEEISSGRIRASIIIDSIKKSHEIDDGFAVAYKFDSIDDDDDDDYFLIITADGFFFYLDDMIAFTDYDSIISVKENTKALDITTVSANWYTLEGIFKSEGNSITIKKTNRNSIYIPPLRNCINNMVGKIGGDSEPYSDIELTISDIIKRHITQIAKSSSAKPYVVSEFDPFDVRNEKRLDKALSKYARKVCKDEVIAFIDISFFGDGGDGILFSKHGISFDWAFEKVYAKYNEISRTEIINRGKDLALYGRFSERKDQSGTPTINNIYFDLDELKECLDEIICII